MTVVPRSHDDAVTAAPFTSSMAQEWGWNRSRLTLAVSEGSIRRVLRDAYVARGTPDTLEVRAACLSLVVKPHGVVVDRTAAWLWGVDVWTADMLGRVPPLEVFSLRGHTRMRRPEAGGGTRDLIDRDVVRLAGLQVTTPLRTALDLACACGPPMALWALDSFAAQHGVTPAALQAELPRFRGRRGVRRARGLVPLLDPRSESYGETRVRLEIHEAGLPPPVLQHCVPGPGGTTYRLDLAYVLERICVEYDGEAYHSSAEQRARDLRRRDWLRQQGWVVLVVTKADWKGPRRDRWIAELGEVLRSSARRS